MRTLGLCLFLAALAPIAISCSAANETPQGFEAGRGGSTQTATGAGGSPNLGTGGYGGGTTTTTIGSDACGNGLDDNGNGIPDEGCPCEAGEWQACWTGPGSRRSVGACKDGVQTCDDYGEFASWGQCEGQTLPSAEIPENGIDEDCDGVDLGGNPCMQNGEQCWGGLDEDCDGYIDCADPDCASSCSSCEPTETQCENGADDDCDSYIDCVDPDCASAPGCDDPPNPPGCQPQFPFIAEVLCGDGKDNDCDGHVDCDDSDCLGPGQCGCAPSETNCSDGVDEDCDDSTDCADLECQHCTPGSTRWCDEPAYCHWGLQECTPSGMWGECVEASSAPPGCTPGGMYNLECCLEAGGCCQNYPTDNSSVGNCSNIVSCE